MASAIFKMLPEDFIVEEVLPYELSGDGEFEFLWVEKVQLTTEQAASAIARFAGLPKRSVSWSGMKDKFSISRQWLAVHLPGKSAPDWQGLNQHGLSVLKSVRHKKKLRVGNHSHNRFIIRLREVAGELDDLENKLQQVAALGVPNYFGEQRFGRAGGTLDSACDWLAAGQEKLPNFKRGLYLSCFRAFLFNQVLAERVEANVWNTPLAGDRLELRGSHSHFSYDAQSETDERIAQGDLSPVASLYGRGDQLLAEDALAIEEALLAQYPEIVSCLSLRTEIAYRALRALPENMQWQWLDQPSGDLPDLRLSFDLLPGSFATAVLAELCHYPEPSSLAVA